MTADRWLLGLFLAALLLLALEPGHVPLWEPSEARYAEIPREMRESGDYVVPRLNGVLYFEKPPLHYWSVAASFRLLGETESAARLPGKLASIVMAVLAWRFAHRRYGSTVGLVAGLIVAASPLVLLLAHLALIDASLSLALSLAVFAFAALAEADEAGDPGRVRRQLYVFYAAAAAGVMLKGLVGLVLPGGAALLWALVTGRGAVVRRLFSPGPVLLFLALTVPWHVLVALREPDFPRFYFLHEHVARFATAGHRRSGPPWFFAAVLLAGLAPWTALLPGLRHVWPGARRAAWSARPTESFLWTFSILVFLFFTLSQSKEVSYLEPIWPPLAVLLALGAARASGGARVRVLAAILFLALTTLVWIAAFGQGWAPRFAVAAPAAVCLGGLALGVMVNAWGSRAPAPGLARTAAGLAVPWLIATGGALLGLAPLARALTPWPIVEAMQRELRHGDRLVQRGRYVQVVPFYARRTTPVSRPGWSELDYGRQHPHDPGLFPSDEEFAALWRGPARVLVVARGPSLGDFLKAPLDDPPALVLARTWNARRYLLANRP